VTRLGLIAGNGRFPVLFAEAARRQGYAVHAVALEGEADGDALRACVTTLDWVKVGQVDAIIRALKGHEVDRAVMAGGVGRVKSLRHARPDLGSLKIVAGLRSLRDDELLRALAEYVEGRGIRVVAPTDILQSVLAREGLLAGPKLSESQHRDVALGREVARRLGQADVGQTVVVKNGVVLAVEAIEGTDECIRRASRLGGRGAVIVKRSKPNQDVRFDLPAAGPVTVEVMRETGAAVLAIEAGKTVLLDAALLAKWADRLDISIVGVTMAE
jgi:DUF1009 family protein